MAILPGMISIDGDLLLNINSVLKDTHDGLPTREDASNVVGTTEEHATAAFMSRVTKIADQLGDHTNVVRVTVKDHVEIMQQAATSMQDNDEHNADWVKTQDTMFDETATSTTAADVTAAQETLESENEAPTSPAAASSTSASSTTSTNTSSTSDVGDM
ncbi:hypothetical protein [Microbacterium sp. KR10-403]|uniref:hypothetical protein n=1 Tax=Microbacterium sp. KR10-403 TaxID=3158581 RepID=UPI0032E51B60